MTKAIVYARVSTDDQADKGFSLSAQVEAGRKYADQQGFTVSQELIDDGVSGALAFSERPAGATAWALLRSGKAQALIVQNVDRLSRDVVDLLVTIRALLRAGVEVHCLDLGRVTSEYDIMLVIRGWQGSDEREKIKKRSMRGKREKLAQGMIVGGRTPYGYDHLRDERGRAVNFTINEEQAAVVRLIFEWYTVGDGDGVTLSQYEIARRLGEAGIQTSFSRSKKKSVWTLTHVSRILNSAVYKGEWCYTASATDDAPEQTFKIAIPAIVDAATWELAQVQKERNRRKAKRNAKRDFLLAGIVKCGCGYTMSGHTKSDGVTTYYRCNGLVYFSRDANPCKEPYLRAQPLEAATWDAIRDLVSDPERLLEKLQKAQSEELAEQEPKRAELEAVNAMRAEAQTEANNLAAALARLMELGQKQGAVGDALEEKITTVNKRYAKLTARRDELEAALANRCLTDEFVNTLMQYAHDAAQGIDHADHALKRRILDGFGASVRVKDGQALLDCRFPVPASIDLHLHW